MRSGDLKPVHLYYGQYKDFVGKLIDNTLLSQAFKPVNDLTSCPIDGAYLTLSKIQSLVILFHSPQGCSTSLWFLWGGAFSLKSVESDSSNSRAITLSTNLSESDVIYGGEEKLRKALTDIKEKYAPKYVAVLSSCCSGIIGENVESIVNEMAIKTGMNIGWLDTSGFKSWYWPNGYDYAHHFIVHKIMPSKNEVKKSQEKTINIITYGNAATVDEMECDRLMEKLGIQALHPFSVPYTSIEKLQQSASAHMNFMMCKTYGLAFCEEMEKKYGTPYIRATHPMGSYYTEIWLREIAKVFNIENECDLVIQKEKENINDRIISIKQQLAGKRVAISAGHDKAPALIALAQELNLVIVYLGILTYDNTTKEKFIEVNKLIDYDFITLVNPQTYEELPIINEMRPDLYIGPAGLTPKVTALNIPAVSTHFNDFIGTFFGFQGVVNFGEYILRSMNDPIPSHMNEEYFFNGNEKICGERWFEKGIASCEK